MSRRRRFYFSFNLRVCAEHWRISCSKSKHFVRTSGFSRTQSSYAFILSPQLARILTNDGTSVLTHVARFSCGSRHCVASPPKRHLWYSRNCAGQYLATSSTSAWSSSNDMFVQTTNLTVRQLFNPVQPYSTK